MSTATLTPDTSVRDAASPRGSAPSTWTLIAVELRKMTDTRAGRWLLLATGLVAAAAAVAQGLTGDVANRTFVDAVQITMLPLGVLLPIIGILAATGEWSQRTAVTTFALVPRRGRVLAGKVGAVLVLGAGGFVVALLAAAVATVVGSAAAELTDPWRIDGGALAQALLFLGLSVVWGLAFGLLLVQPGLAIVGFFVLPTIFTVVGQLASGLKDALEWIDPNVALAPLSDATTSGADWGRIATASILWIAVPLALGIRRNLRREVK
ncbi:hypothetical protein [Patulibacter sp.]|uniref:hypothetical protein n=1 Tax=Patulibacter sp. TaxID=1912859 RepID=UPI0027249DB7|nr:hypothetical protein [Patulibacter sp.]MDO9407937.1 hypothetical protein [Patulibacter sp.]